MSDILELEEKLNETLRNYQDLSNIGYKELEDVMNTLDEYKAQAYDMSTNMFTSLTRDERGRFIGKDKVEYDIKEMAELTDKVDEITDILYDEINRIAIIYEQKKKRFMSNFKIMQEIDNKIRLRNQDIKRLKANIEECDKNISMHSNNNEIKAIYENIKKVCEDGIKEIENIINDLTQEKEYVRAVMGACKNGGIIPDREEKAIEEEVQKQAEEEAQKQAEEEAQKKAEEESQKQAEEEAQKKAEEEAQKKAEEEAQKKAEEEAQKKAEEEAQKKAEEDAQKQDEEDLDNIPEEQLEDPNEEIRPVIVPKVTGNKPKLTWKTAIAVAAGVGIGAGVFFAAGPVGVGIMMLSGGIAKKIISNQEKKLSTLTRLDGEQKGIVEEPSPGLKGVIGRFKNYIKSPEGLRDIKWMINAAMITGSALTIGQAINNYIVKPSTPTALPDANTMSNAPVETMPSVNQAPTVPQSPSVPSTPSVPVDTAQVANATNNTLGYENIRLGQSVGNYNVSVGYDSASYAINGQNAEILNSNLVNAANSQFGRFRVINPDGTKSIIDSAGTSIQDLINQGYDVSKIAIDVANNQGASQAWVSVSDLMSGGKAL